MRKQQLEREGKEDTNSLQTFRVKNKRVPESPRARSLQVIQAAFLPRQLPPAVLAPSLKGKYQMEFHADAVTRVPKSLNKDP